MTKILRGTWVEIERVLLTPAERAPQVPDDTKAVPYVLKVAGFLLSEASLGDDVVVTTLIGRKLSGRLVTVNPSYTHSFGSTIPELLAIGKEEHLA